jgi:hypothetical protein
LLEPQPVWSIGDTLRLRTRPLSDYSGLGPQVQVMNAVNEVNGQALEVDVLLGGIVDPARFPAGSLLYQATIDPQTGDELMLCAKTLKDSFRQTGLPLNRKVGDACQVDRRDLQPVVNVPAGLPAGRPPYRSWLIGYYDGGGEAHCGIFHPAGACVMRQLKIAANSKQRANVAYRFCAVCRYILTDVLNPRFHPQVDREYTTFYPL